MSAKSDMEIFVTDEECRNPIVEELSIGKPMTFYMLKMKMDVMGYTPDYDFLYIFIRLASSSDTIKKTLIDCIRHGMFTEMFREWNVFKRILLLQNDYFMKDVSKIVIYTISEIRPGIIIGHFLKHGEVSGRKLMDSDKFFTNITFKLSSRMSNENYEYKKAYHDKVLSVIMGNWNMESIMN